MVAPNQLDESVTDPTLKLFYSIGELNLAGENDVPNCHTYTPMEIFKFNYFVWTLGFFFGLQWTHADVGPLQKITLEWDIIKTWGKGLWILFLSLVAIILGIVFVVFRVYYEIGYLKWYALYAIWGIGFIYIKTRCEKGKKKLHIHHYFWSAIIVTFLCYQSVFITFVAGFFNGVNLEGGANWGYDPIWLPLDEGQKLMTSKPRKEIEEDLMDKDNHTSAHRRAWIVRKTHQENIRHTNGEASKYQIPTGYQAC